VSKRHQSSRRKSYGRRQHELRERADRRSVADRFELGWDVSGESSPIDAFAFLDPRSSRLRFALGD
jgi:hypothetical protein